MIKKIFSSESILKIFHDLTEDSSILHYYLGVDLRAVFDTQVAHRILYESKNCSANYTKHSSISLSDLISHYLYLELDSKSKGKIEMKRNLTFWETRPFNTLMLEYAAGDVKYLPKIYYQMVLEMDSTLYLNVLAVCSGCLKYIDLNQGIGLDEVWNNGEELLGLISNIQLGIVYLKLNLDKTAIILHDKSIDEIINKYQVGSFIPISLDLDKEIDFGGKYIAFLRKQVNSSNSDILKANNIILDTKNSKPFYPKNKSRKGSKNGQNQLTQKILKKDNITTPIMKTSTSKTKDGFYSQPSIYKEQAKLDIKKQYNFKTKLKVGLHEKCND